ncbi:MAG: hypothetical protein ABMA14_17965 [Hyphomonadaceae bacterium]
MSDLDDRDRKTLRDLLVRRTLENTKSAEAARAWLVGQGLYDGDGKLTPQFGGEEKTED